MRRVFAFVLGALAFVVLAGASNALAEGETTTTTAPSTTTTTTPPVTVDHSTTTLKPTTTTMKAGATTTTTTQGFTGAKPPPASGASQPLDPSIVGGPVVIFDTSTTLLSVDAEPTPSPTTATPSRDPSGTIQIASKKSTPSGTTLALASVAWLASLGGLLVYAEDQRSNSWRHLAR